MFNMREKSMSVGMPAELDDCMYVYSDDDTLKTYIHMYFMTSKIFRSLVLQESPVLN